MITNEENINEYLKYCKYAKNLSNNTLKAYISDLYLFMLFEHDTGSGIYEYVTYLSDTKHKTTNIKRNISTIYQLYNFIYRNDKLNNPINTLNIKLKSEKILPKTISKYEMKKLFQCLYSKSTELKSDFKRFQITRDIALLDFISSTGIRIGEAALLKIHDIDFRSHLVLIHGKGRKERIIYLSCPDTVANLKNWLQLRKSLKVNNEYVFLNRHLQALSIHGIEDIFRKYRDAAKINKNSTPHYLRHTFATNLLANGSDIRSVQEILGHSSISITERYTEVTQNQKIKILKKYNYRNTLFQI